MNRLMTMSTPKDHGQASGFDPFGPWITVRLAHKTKTICLMRSENALWTHPFYVIDTCTSTMDLAGWLSERGVFPEWASVLAGHQSEGRGQFRRSWASCPGNLYASIRLPRRLTESPLTPLVLAFAVQRVFEDLGLDCRFKWPNDLLVSQKKVGGILVEHRGDTVIAGIGINLARSPEPASLNKEPVFPAGDLGSSGLLIPAAELWRLIVESLIEQLQNHEDQTHPDTVLAALEHRMAFLGETVMMKPHHGEAFSGRITGLSPSGGLCLITARGQVTCCSGSVFPLVDQGHAQGQPAVPPYPVGSSQS